MTAIVYTNYSDISDMVVGGGLKENEELRTRFKKELHATWHTRLSPKCDGNKERGWIVPKENRQRLAEFFADLETKPCAKRLLKIRNQTLRRYQQELKKCQKELKFLRSYAAYPTHPYLKTAGTLATEHVEPLEAKIRHLKGLPVCELCSAEWSWYCDDCGITYCQEHIPGEECPGCIPFSYCISCTQRMPTDQFVDGSPVCRQCRDECGGCKKRFDQDWRGECKVCGLAFDANCYAIHVNEGRGCTRYRTPRRRAG